MNRESWTLQDYIDHLDRLFELENEMGAEQFKELYALIKEEMIMRFPKSEREKFSLVF